MDPAFAHIPPTSVLPLRGGKQTVYEGGIRVPQIIVWPGVTPAGSVSHALTCSTDFFPTFIDLLGWDFSQAPDFDGVSLRPVLEGTGEARDEILCHFPHRQDTRPYEGMVAPHAGGPAASLRKGDWKIIRFFAEHQDGSDRFELYHLGEDIGQRRDLSGTQPERLTQLRTLLDQRLTEMQAVIPKRNPAFRPTMP